MKKTNPRSILFIIIGFKIFFSVFIIFYRHISIDGSDKFN